MKLQKYEINTNNTNKEQLPHGTEDFPCAGYEYDYSNLPGDTLSWHWHDDFEIVLASKGSIILKVPTKTIYLSQGEIAIINANVAHYGEGAPLCSLQSLVFSPLLLAGNNSSAIFKKYLSPLIECPEFTCIHIEKTDSCREHFLKAFEAIQKNIPFYEFTVREQLSIIMIKVYSIFQDHLTDSLPSSGIDNDRIKEMLDFIHSNYKESISLTDICRAGNIGEREALRCFKRSIGESPIQHLLKYRLIQSADMLLSNPDKDISEIAGICGFNSFSYYSKKFRELYLCTPRAYRKSRQHFQSDCDPH